MEGEEFHIELVDGAQPFCVHTPRMIPFAYRKKLQDELALLQSQGIIAPVTTPTEWCAPIVVTPKKDSDRIRLCVDLSRLNKYVRRERYQSPSPAQAVVDIEASKSFIHATLIISVRKWRKEGARRNLNLPKGVINVVSSWLALSRGH